MCILNRGTTPQHVDFSWQEEKVADGFADRETLFGFRVYRIRDLWTGKDLGTTQTPLQATVPGHDVLMVRLIRLLEAAAN